MKNIVSKFKIWIKIHEYSQFLDKTIHIFKPDKFLSALRAFPTNFWNSEMPCQQKFYNSGTCIPSFFQPMKLISGQMN